MNRKKIGCKWWVTLRHPKTALDNTTQYNKSLRVYLLTLLCRWGRVFVVLQIPTLEVLNTGNNTMLRRHKDNNKDETRQIARQDKTLQDKTIKGQDKTR